MKPNSQHLESLPTHYSLELGELISIVWRRKMCVLVCLGATLALGAVYYFQAERVYEIKCRLLVEKQELPVSESAARQRTQRDAEFLGTQAEILGSPSVIAMAVDQVHWPVPTSPEVSPVALFKERISVRPVMGTNVLSLSLQADNADRAVEALDALIESYRSYVNQVEHDAHGDVLEMLAKSEKETRADLDQLELQYRQMRERSPVIAGFRNGIDVQLSHVDQLGRQLAATRGRRVELENQLRIASTEVAEALADEELRSPQNFLHTSLVVAPAVPAAQPDGGALTSDLRPSISELMPKTLVGANLPGARDISAIQNQLVQCKVLRQELDSRFGPKHPEVRAVEEQISSLVMEEQKAFLSGHELLRRELQTVLASERQLEELCQNEMQQTKQLDSYRLQEQQLVSQVARVQEVHDSIVNQLRQWKLTGQMVSEGGSQIRIAVLEAPVAPLKPVWPATRILFGICGAVGLLTGFGLVAFLEQKSRQVRSVSESISSLTDSATDEFGSHSSSPYLPQKV